MAMKSEESVIFQICFLLFLGVSVERVCYLATFELRVLYLKGCSIPYKKTIIILQFFNPYFSGDQICSSFLGREGCQILPK